MSSTNYLRTRWAESTPRARQASRRANLPSLAGLARELCGFPLGRRSWFTRRLSARAARRRWLDLSLEGRAVASRLGWRRAP